MKTLLTTLIALSCAENLLVAESGTTTQVSPRVTAREGFTRSGAKVVLTRQGATVDVTKEVVLENGMRVKPDGGVTLPNGEKANLPNNQLLTLKGTFEDVALRPDGVAPLRSVVAPPVEEGAAR